MANPLARGGCQRRVACPANRQILFLRTRPFGDEQICERCACTDHIARCAAINALDEAGSARLHDSDITLVEIDRAGGGDAGPQRSHPGLNHAQAKALRARSEEHTSELQSLMRISYAVFCLKKKNSYNLSIYRRHVKANKG